MSIKLKLLEVKIFQIQSILNAIRHIDQRVCVQELWYFESGLDI